MAPSQHCWVAEVSSQRSGYRVRYEYIDYILYTPPAVAGDMSYY